MIISFSVVSYLFLSGFNRLEAILGGKIMTLPLYDGLMAAWILWDVILRYTSRRGRHKLYDRLSLGVYVFLLVSLLTAFFINFGTVIGLSVLFLVFVEAGIVWWRQADAAKRKKFKRRLPVDILSLIFRPIPFQGFLPFSPPFPCAFSFLCHCRA